jgi:uncharacterized protein YecE (DUF72 family)
MPSAQWYLGCPIWAFRGWVGSLYRSGSRADEWLEQYASVFGAVEGNGTFYGLPDVATVERWRAATPERFRFCFKLPKRITHELMLRACERELDEFLRRLEPLGPRLGPFMIQLPAQLGPAELPALDGFLRGLPAAFRFGVELRHPAFFRAGRAAREADALLAGRGVERVVLDARALRAGPAAHPDVVAALHVKPDLPLPARIDGAQPIVRFVAHPLADIDEPWLAEWAQTLAGWIEEGRSPYFMLHCANNLHAPALARRAHELLATRTRVEPLPAWPGERERSSTRQLSLFAAG